MHPEVHAGGRGKSDLNTKSKDFLAHVQSVLVSISAIAPILKGIEAVKINDVEVKNADQYVDEELVFKN
ncbi:MAG: hypothetical protein ABSE82_14160, partial [Nitrososphaerales archaeon]